MRTDDNRVIPFRPAPKPLTASRTVHVDIEIDLIRQCREDWRRGETEIWRHFSLEVDICRDAEGQLRLHGLPGQEAGLVVVGFDAAATPGAGGSLRLEEPGLCVTVPLAALHEAATLLQPATVVPFALRRAG
jgi:hypothetical protein